MKNRTKCCQEIVGGSSSVDPKANLDAVNSAWREAFEADSRRDDRQLLPVRDIVWAADAQVTVEEVQIGLKLLRKGADGPDGVTLAEIRSLAPEELAAWFNIWLDHSWLPDCLTTGMTTLIPKKAKAKEAADFRSITVSSRLVRIKTRATTRGRGASPGPREQTEKIDFRPSVTTEDRTSRPRPRRVRILIGAAIRTRKRTKPSALGATSGSPIWEPPELP